MMRIFQPSLIVLDLMLPNISGVDVIKEIRSEPDFAKLPIIVFSNTYLTNLIQDAWRAGANKCLSKASCSPKEFVEVVLHTIGSSGAMPQANNAPSKTELPTKLLTLADQNDVQFQADLRKTFIESLPATLYALRQTLQGLNKADSEVTQLRQVYELYRRVHALNGNAGLAGMPQIARLSSAFEALLKEIYEKPKNINPSSIRTIASAVDFLGVLFDRCSLTERTDLVAPRILVVDDEAISRRAIIYALKKAQLKSVNVDDAGKALELLAANSFDLVFLDVDMPGMTGFELCAKLRSLPQHKKTPVVFITALNDFENRTNSMMAGGNDFIAKPFLFIELTVKALIYVMRSRLPPKSSVLS
jgi:CheY-like chemotaxis protein